MRGVDPADRRLKGALAEQALLAEVVLDMRGDAASDILADARRKSSLDAHARPSLLVWMRGRKRSGSWASRQEADWGTEVHNGEGR